MGYYLFNRILLFVPTLLVISLLAFGLSRCAPGDPVEPFVTQGEQAQGNATDYLAYQQAYRRIATQLGLDKPVFYFTLTTAAYPADTLHRVVQKSQREAMTSLAGRYGQWPTVQAYFRQLGQAEAQLAGLASGYRGNQLITVRNTLRALGIEDNPSVIAVRLDTLVAAASRDTLLADKLGPALALLQNRFQQLAASARPTNHLLPNWHWHGIDNQYHHWLTNLLRGDFGLSYRDQRPVGDKIGDAVRWTLGINLLAILLAYLLAIPIGVYSAVYPHSWGDRTANLLLFVLYSLPSFWVATLLTVFLTTREYGMDWFPGMGVGDVPAGASVWTALSIRASHLFLPVLTLTYGSLAFIARQVRNSMLEVLEQPYIRTARAKGVSAAGVVWTHAFRNALFPLITLFASILPAALAGSVVIESIFNIPGMGKLTVEAILNKDWPVVYTLLMLAAVLTVVGILLADIGYALADPRVSYRKKN